MLKTGDCKMVLDEKMEMLSLKTLSDHDFESERAGKILEIENKLKDYLPGELLPGKAFQHTILEAMEYSLLGGGKRLRPMFMREAYTLFSGGKKETETLFYFMAAMEMIHTYSLVHDDLPAMDDDDLRRGRKTTHKVYGEAMGILCGDALLNFAYETAVRGAMLCEDKSAALRALRILTEKAGVFGMVGGQVVDVEMTGKPLTEEQLLFIYRLKTGALLEASLMVGGVLAGASEEQAAKLEQIGNGIGMAFQIQDDILDLTGTTEELGKPVHSDEKNEKTTYVTVYGLEAAGKAAKDYSFQALSLLQELSESLETQNPYLNTLICSLVHRKY